MHGRVDCLSAGIVSPFAWSDSLSGGQCHSRRDIVLLTVSQTITLLQTELELLNFSICGTQMTHLNDFGDALCLSHHHEDIILGFVFCRLAMSFECFLLRLILNTLFISVHPFRGPVAIWLP